jgi:hypothetical protein
MVLINSFRINSFRASGRGNSASAAGASTNHRAGMPAVTRSPFSADSIRARVLPMP